MFLKKYLFHSLYYSTSKQNIAFFCLRNRITSCSFSAYEHVTLQCVSQQQQHSYCAVYFCCIPSGRRRVKMRRRMLVSGVISQEKNSHITSYTARQTDRHGVHVLQCTNGTCHTVLYYVQYLEWYILLLPGRPLHSSTYWPYRHLAQFNSIALLHLAQKIH